MSAEKEIINDEIEEVIPVPEMPVVKDGEKDETDYKALAEKQREVAEQNRGIAQRNKTRAERFKANGGKPAEKTEEKKPEGTVGKPSELDYGQKAFLVAKGIEEADEVDAVKAAMASSGKSLEEVLNANWFKAELKEIRDAKATDKATPPGSKRGTNSAKDTVEYWVAKGELPPASEVELRRKVVNARIKAETNDNNFTSQPVVGGGK